jgi:hypothetical protein
MRLLSARPRVALAIAATYVAFGAPLAAAQHGRDATGHPPGDHGHASAPADGPQTKLSALAQRQISAVLSALEPFRDPKAAVAAGYRKPDSDTPTMGAHWVNGDLVRDGRIDLRKPEILMYADIGGKPTLVGVSYLTPSPKGAAFPEGFDGPNDAWHRHDPGEASSFAAAGRQRNGAARAAAGGRGARGAGMGIAMSHFWVIDAVGGPFTDHNHWLPFVSSGLPHPGDDISRQHPIVVAEASLALAAWRQTSTIMKRAAEAVRGADASVLKGHLSTIAALAPDYAAHRSAAKDDESIDHLNRLAQEWRAIREIFLRNVPAKQKAILTQAFDNMTRGHPHGHM